jgi:Peroxisomal biogenesis factor 11 (PEX11)
VQVPHDVPTNLCRKALKLGKFLADVDKLRKLSTHSHMWVAQLVAAGGEVVYLFLEQVTW